MNIIIKGDVKSDIISDGGVKNETRYHYGDEHKMGQQTQNSETRVSATSQEATSMAQGTTVPSRQGVMETQMELIDKGEWTNGASAEGVKQVMRNMLEDEQAELVWKLLENGRGARLHVPWQNMISYFVDRKFLPTTIGAPALNRMFFGDDDGYSNIDKGRPRNQDYSMSNGFREVLPLLDKHFPFRLPKA